MRDATGYAGRRRSDEEEAAERSAHCRWEGLGSYVRTCVRSIDHDVLSVDHTHVKADVVDGSGPPPKNTRSPGASAAPGANFDVVLYWSCATRGSDTPATA